MPYTSYYLRMAPNELKITYIRATKAAAMLEVDPKTINRWVQNGTIKNAFKLNPNLKNSPLLVASHEIEAMIAARMIAHYTPKDQQ